MTFTNVLASRLSDQDNYNALCSCPDQPDQCQQCQRSQSWATSKWRPQNWKHWPLIKKSLIVVLVLTFVIWLLVYLILHFKNDRPANPDQEPNKAIWWITFTYVRNIFCEAYYDHYDEMLKATKLFQFFCSPY